MKRTILSISILLTLALSAGFAQLGLGIGSHGLNIRTNPDARTGIIIRTGFGVHVNPLHAFIKPEAMWVKRHHYSDRTKLYAGLGVTGVMRIGVQQLAAGYGMIIPVGLELFPLDTRKMSVSIETGLDFLNADYTDRRFGNYGLIEITFYLN